MANSNCPDCHFAARCRLYSPVFEVPAFLCPNSYAIAEKKKSQTEALPSYRSVSGKIMDMPTGARDFLFNTWQN